MSAKQFAPFMAEFLRQLALELENNQALAKRLAFPFEQMLAEHKPANVPAKSRSRTPKPEALIPEGFDPFQIYYEQGSPGLYAGLQGLEVPVLKSILAHFALDPARSYTQWRKHERLVNFIVDRVRTMSSKGQVFRNQ